MKFLQGENIGETDLQKFSYNVKMSSILNVISIVIISKVIISIVVVCSAITLLANIKQGWQCLPRTSLP
jgi:hypothetical protein